MAVTTTNYGSFRTHTSATLSDVAGALKGIPATDIVAFFWDAGASKYLAIERI